MLLDIFDEKLHPLSVRLEMETQLHELRGGGKSFFFGHAVRSQCGALLEMDVEITTLEPHPECKNCKTVLNAKPLEIQIWQIFNDNNQN